MAYVTVKGTITKFHNSGTGFAIEEKWTNRDGIEMKKTWQIFPETATEAQPGNQVTINGTLASTVYTFTEPNTLKDVHTVSQKVNNAKVTIDNATTAPQVESAPF